ncbi:MAG TPA: hypothetical protein VGN14_09355 [Candidatus Elarobacter sp.]
MTATESGWSSFTAQSSCAAVSVSGTNPFTLTANSPASSGCTITVQGFGSQTATVAATVPAPGGVQLRWVGPGYQNQSPPIALLNGPINIVGTGALFAATLVVTENAYLGTFTAPTISAGCGGNIALSASAGAGLPAAAPGASTTFYTVTASGAVASGAGCTISAGDTTAVPSSSAQISVVVTTGSGSFQ